MNMIGQGFPSKRLGNEEIRQIVGEACQQLAPQGRRILVVVPDQTRTCPLPQLARALHENLAGVAEKLDFLIALGTHPQLSDREIDALFGCAELRFAQVFPGSTVYNHEWDNPEQLARVGTLSAERIEEISGGLFAMDVEVTINKRVFDYDLVLIAGPVFPHEVVGFSGGSKYFFPGICGPELLNFFHWLGAMISNPRIIGSRNTPVRATLEAAADMLPFDRAAFCMVVEKTDLAGLFFGPVREAWAAAAELSDRLHVTYMDHPFDSVLSCAPPMYNELWVGGKCMYKLEPVVADGGELIIYAPHIHEISITHGRLIEQIGYHTRDYFLQQWDQFKDFPWGVLAHSTHVRGIGSYVDGIDHGRIEVTLATGIPEETCRKINLGYRDPASIDPADWQNAEDQGKLYVPKAGEMLYKLKNPPEWQRL